jgi:hypothetical protein
MFVACVHLFQLVRVLYLFGSQLVLSMTISCICFAHCMSTLMLLNEMNSVNVCFRTFRSLCDHTQSCVQLAVVINCR